MIDFYTWATPNGRKVAIMLEEADLEYTLHPINITTGEQHTAAFTRLNPNGKIPVIVDHDAAMDGGTSHTYTLYESGAILFYLAHKCGQFGPANDAEKWTMLQWMMFQMSAIGPVFGQVHHFSKFNPGKSAYAEQRYLSMAETLYQSLDDQLQQRQYITGDYSIVDMATWPWVARYDWQNIDLDQYPNVKRWYVTIANRPAVKRAWHSPPTDQSLPMP